MNIRIILEPESDGVKDEAFEADNPEVQGYGLFLIYLGILGYHRISFGTNLYEKHFVIDKEVIPFDFILDSIHLCELEGRLGPPCH